MANFRNPVVIAKENAENKWFWSIVDGIFIWEVIVTLNYEWSVIRGRRPYRWTIWIFSFTRVATLATVVLNICSMNVTPINCQIMIDSQFIVSYLVIAASSLLIVLRIVAIWNRNQIVVALATGIWVIDFSFLIQGAARFRSSWDREINDCAIHMDSIRLSTICALVADITLLLLMLLGLCRLRRHGGLMTLGRLLWNQGVIWLLVTVIAELTPTVFILLNLNAPLNVMFQIPWVITMSIAATRMYRSLSDFLSFDVSQETLPTSGRTALEANGASKGPIFFNDIQVAVPTTHEQHSTSQTNRFVPNITMQPHGKPHEIILDFIVNDHDIEAAQKNEPEA